MANVTTAMWLRVALALSLSVPSVGRAQAGGKRIAGAGVEIEEIVVTAQKREENIQETPISITSLTDASLQEKTLSSLSDIAAAVPNVRIGAVPSSINSMIVVVRGVGQTNPDPGFPEKVGLYLDGVYLSKPRGTNFDLEDVERVEALRGPQGTLYGRNSAGGAVNFITKKPTEEREVTLASEVGNFETFKERLTFNLPLIGKNGFFQSDALGTLSLRETAGYKSHDGYFRNELTSNMPPLPRPSGTTDYNNDNRVFTYTALRWQPIRNVTLDYMLEYHRYRDSPAASQLTYVYPGSLASRPTLGPNPNPFYDIPYIQKNRSDVTPTNAELLQGLRPHATFEDGRQIMHTLTGAWDVGEVGPLGAVTLKSISGYRSFIVGGAADNDGSLVHIADTGSTTDAQHGSEELQVIGVAPRIHYLLGAYYYGEYYTLNRQQSFIGGASSFPMKNIGTTKSYALFGQATWTPPVLNDRLNLTAGVRFTQEQVHLDHTAGRWIDPSSTIAGFHQAGGKAFGGLHGRGAPGISPTGDISYQWTDDLLTYFRVSRGYTGGGFNPGGTTREQFTSFLPERLWSFEAGFKSQWLDKRLQLNADGFFMYYQDFQANVSRVSATSGVFSVYSNAERAEMWGTEFEGVAIPFRGLEAAVTYSFFAPKYTKWLDQKVDAAGRPVFDAAGKPVLESVGDRRSFSYNPKHQAGVGLTYTAPPTTTGTFSAHLDVYWQDKLTFVNNNEPPGAQADEGWAYALVNGRLIYSGIPLVKGSLDIAVFARNLLDRKYRIGGVDYGASLGVASNAYGDPRTFGLQLTYNFSES